MSVYVENLSKVFRIYDHPRDRLFELFLRQPRHRPFVALEGISFEVSSGETFGIVGPNGAGKSTLLKILAGTLKPTSGKVIVDGKIAALLELGAGFHPELSGRENIYLSASLLGLPDSLIRQREKEIISFAELEEFIDRPLKTYSSGMQVRLAFSIAVQVDPDVLIVDEALSVGDHHFQKKSLDRIMDFRRRGKTILFCSHNMYHVLHLCQRAMWLENGRIKMLGPVEKVVKAYEDVSREKTSAPKQEGSSHYPVKVKISLSRTEIYPRESLVIEVSYHGQHQPLHFGFIIKRNDEEIVFAESTEMQKLPPFERPSGCFRIKLPRLNLLPGRYLLGVVASDDTASIPLGESWRVLEVKRPAGEKRLGITWIDTQWQLLY